MAHSTEELIIPNIEEAVIGREENPLRFERFCVNVYEASQGVPTVTTGYTWDLGRDGRSISSRPHLICASLRADVDKKASEDILRVSQTTKAEVIVFCSTQNLTEHACDLIAKEIRKRNINTDAVVLGRQQLADLAREHSSVFNKHYQSDLTHIRNALLTPNYSSETTQANALRLALCTHGHETAQELRGEVLKTIVLEVIQQFGSQTKNNLARRMAESLRLPKPPKEKAIQSAIDDLCQKGHLAKEKEKIIITDLGIASLGADTKAVERLLEGKTEVHKSLESNLGYSIAAEEFSVIWQIIQDSLADLFYENGLAVVNGIGALLESEGTTAENPDVQDLSARIETMAARATKQVSPTDRKKEIHQAISDTFLERGTVAFNWLSQVAATFMCIASLGLEGSSAEALKKCIARTILVLDVDVLISFFCEAEPVHRDAREIITEWRSIGGQVAVSPVVMEEVAHHAWISQNDFSETYSLRGVLTSREDWLFENAFVRTYWTKARKFSPKEWREYIDEFRGLNQYDYKKIEDIAIRDHRFAIMQEVDDSHEVAKMVKSFLLELQGDSENRKAFFEDKSRKDGRLLGSVCDWRTRLRNTGSEQTVCVVSSSSLLQKAAARFKNEIGEPEAVMPLAAVGYLLSLIPNVRISLTSLRSLLFSSHRYRFVARTQRIALRALAASREYTFPMSRRVTLLHKLDEALRRESRARGVSVEEQKADFESGKDSKSAARVMADAMDALAVPSKLEKENEELRKRIQKLEDTLARQSRKP